MGYHRPRDREAVNHGMYLAGLNYGKRIANEWSLFLPVVVFVVVVGGSVVVGSCVAVGGSVVVDGSVVEGCVVDVSEEKQKQRFFESIFF